MLPVLLVVNNLQGVHVDSHDPVFWVLVAASSQGRSDEVVVGQFGGIGNCREEPDVVGVAVAVELASDCVGESISQGIEPH